MTAADTRKRRPFGVLLLLAGGGLCLALAWMLPVNLKSVSPALLRAAGEDTRTVAQFGRELVANEKLGPAALVLQTARALKDPGAAALASDLETLAAKQRELVAWGGWDPFLDPLFNLRESKGRNESTPILTFFLPEVARETLRNYLANSRSQGVQAVLATREVRTTGRFVPATLPGGQPLDAVILLTALLFQGDHLSAALQREVRQLSETAKARGELGPLEDFYIDLLSLGRRLDWVQLSELLRSAETAVTVGEYAHLSRVAPDQLPLIYTAALFSGTSERVAGYLIQFGNAGIEDLRFSLGAGEGAVRQLVLRQAPISGNTPTLGPIAEFGLLHPVIGLVLKWGGFLIGAFLLLRGLDRLFLSAPAGSAGVPHLQGSVLALLIAGMLVLATEPFLLNAAPLSEFRLRITIPVLAGPAEVAGPRTETQSFSMDTKTLLSITLFAGLQVAMYLICLMKIREVARTNVPPLVKLKLMENEENLFDGGLYVGIGGTATALVLQVLNIIDQNLLAAYSSNLFGIVCVALVKIRHVRPFKRQLIIGSQEEARVLAT